MANDPADQSSNDLGKPSGWSDVTDALEALGSSITHAAQETADEADTKRRMRELAEGLAALAHQVGETAELIEAPDEPAAAPMQRPARTTVLKTAADAEECAAVEAPPEVLSAIQAANAKFRGAAETWGPAQAPAPEPAAVAAERPAVAEPAPVEPVAPAIVMPEEPTSVTGVIGAAIGGKVAGLFGGGTPARTHAPAPAPEPVGLEEQSIHDWLFPDGEQEDLAGEEPAGSEPEAGSDILTIEEAGEVAPGPAAAPSVEPTATPQPAAGEPLDAVRVAHERFLAERKLAEAAAESARERAAKPKRSRRRPAPRPDDDATRG